MKLELLHTKWKMSIVYKCRTKRQNYNTKTSVNLFNFSLAFIMLSRVAHINQFSTTQTRSINQLQNVIRKCGESAERHH